MRAVSPPIKIGFGGGCHWCTEAVFQSLRGVTLVEQGFISSRAPHDSFSEAVIVTFTPDIIPLGVLVDVHLRTHASTSLHKMRGKYRSAIYVYCDEHTDAVQRKIWSAQSDFDKDLITLTLPFETFKATPEQFQNYYKSNTGKPFCTAYIDPKLGKIRKDFSAFYQPAVAKRG